MLFIHNIQSGAGPHFGVPIFVSVGRTESDRKSLIRLENYSRTRVANDGTLSVRVELLVTRLEDTPGYQFELNDPNSVIGCTRFCIQCVILCHGHLVRAICKIS